MSNRSWQEVTLACHAMATRFELVLRGPDPVALRAAGEEALEAIQQLEDQISPYRPGSSIARVNARAAVEPVRVEPIVFELLQRARALHEQTRGAFDVTIGPLTRCWGFMGGSGAMPEAEALRAARALVGMDRVELDLERWTVRFTRPGVLLDLGAIGKGYAIERAITLLREAAVPAALLHGGTSTVYGLGPGPDATAWKIAVEHPAFTPGTPPLRLATAALSNQALSVSAVWGRSFQSQGRSYGHVLDPRTGHPVLGATLAAVVTESATESDALSTALLIVGIAGHEAITKLRPGMRTLVVEHDPDSRQLRHAAQGIEVYETAG